MDLDRFLRLVEKQTQLAVPIAWRTSVERAKYNSGRTVMFFIAEPYFPKRDVLKRAILDRASPRQEGDRCIVQQGDVSLALPAKSVDWENTWAKVKASRSTAYVVSYGGLGPYPLCAVQRSTSRTVWSLEVWATGWYMRGHNVRTEKGYIGFGGPGIDCVEMQLAGHRLGVFGLCGAGAYVEVLDARTGRAECRFCTSYYPDE